MPSLSWGGCLRAQIKAASAQAGVSTASLGKFDARLPGEKPGERAARRKRQKFEAVAGRGRAESNKVGGWSRPPAGACLRVPEL
jgi:regulator of ribosome biosynthesis